MFSTITSSQTRSTPRSRASLVQRLHQRPAGAATSLRRDDADAADPGVRPAKTEIREADRLTVAERDRETPRGRGRRSPSGTEASLRRPRRARGSPRSGGEERGQLLVAETGGRMQLELAHGRGYRGTSGSSATGRTAARPAAGVELITACLPSGGRRLLRLLLRLERVLRDEALGVRRAPRCRRSARAATSSGSSTAPRARRRSRC